MMGASEKILVTGAAGFIGYHLCQQLLLQGAEVVGIDNLNEYYDVTLKETRISRLKKSSKFLFQKIDLGHRPSIERLFRDHHFQKVIHLGAQAGVRYSIENPHVYVDSNIVGFLNILEGCRHGKIEHLVFASSSSVYGKNRDMPFTVDQNVDHPVSLYAATKKSNELMAHTYSHLYGLPITGLRFFTVYGPWGRPDMAPFLFASAIFEGRPIKVFNNGDMKRDFTYVGDIVDGVIKTLSHQPKPLESSEKLTPGTSNVPYRIYNIGNNKPIALMRFIELLELSIGKEAKKEFFPMQPGDVKETFADTTDLQRDVGFKANTPIEVGVPKFVAWFRDYYGYSAAP